MENTSVIGHHAKTVNGQFLNQYGEVCYNAPEPCSISEAYRRISVYFASNPANPAASVYPVTRTLTPMETASRELGSLLTDLCRRHGLDLGLSKDQIERQIAKELSDLGATGVGILGAIPRR